MRTDEKRGKTFNYIFLLASLLLTSAVIQSCEEEEPKKNPETDYIEYEASEGEIGRGGGSVVIDDPNSSINGAKVEIPEGALNDLEFISISQNSLEIPGYEDALLLHFEPTGLEFDEPIKLFLPYKGEIDDPIVYYFDSDSSEIKQIEKLEHDQSLRIVSASTNPFL